MNRDNCDSCDKLVDWGNNPKHFGWMNKYILCTSCSVKMQKFLLGKRKIAIEEFIQPERSKREDNEK